MSETDDDLELQALARQLDDAFETTRPRPGFDDELWQRVQSKRPAPHRLRNALAGLWQGMRTAPGLPAMALILIVAIGVGVLSLNYRGGGGGASGGAATSQFSGRAPAAGQALVGSFGRVPSPAFANPSNPAPTQASGTPLAGADYAGAVRLAWTGNQDLTIATAPVYRYGEPSTSDADRFASSVGAVLTGRPSGFLGSYRSSDYTLKVRGTVSSPPSSPAYFIFSGLNLPAVDAAGGPQEHADVFLAEHGLQPQWQYGVMIDSSGDPTRVVYQRQFFVPDFGPAYLVDYKGNRYGLEIDLSGNRPVVLSGMLPVALDIAPYELASPSGAIHAANAAANTGTSQLPAVQVNQAELVYVLVPAGDHSYYEPAYLLSGTVNDSGKSYPKHVLVSAVDPSQRT